MGVLKDLTGKRFGHLVVISREKNIGKCTTWLCLCDCGKKTIVRTNFITHGKTKSCGCLIKESNSRRAKYGKPRNEMRVYRIWKGIKRRCFKPKSKGFINYGGRGIAICDDWMSFENFYQWAVNNGYSDNLTIERIDVNGNYEPKNCKWITMSMQGRNKRNNKTITFNGITKTYVEWEEYLGFPLQTITKRKYKGWDDIKILTTIQKKVELCN